MFCDKCGKSNKDNAQFCEFCGNKLVSNAINKNIAKEVNKKVETDARQDMAVGMERPVSKLNLIIVFEIIAVIVLIYIGKVIGDKYYNPEYLASQYFECLINGHPDKAYEYCLKNNETDFISKDMYCSIMETGNGRITSYKIEKKEQDFSMRKYNIKYRFVGDSDTNTMTITMEKNSGKKKFFIFTDWKVSMVDYICKDYAVHVPKGSEVKLDEVVLSEKNAEVSLDEETGYETYKLNGVFIGDHVIEIKKEYFQDIKRNIHISYSDNDDPNYYAEDIYLEKSILDKLAKDAKDKFKYIMQAAANDDYSSIIDKCVEKEGRESSSDSLSEVMPSYFDELDVSDISFQASDYYNDYEYYSDYVAVVVAEAELGYLEEYYGYDYKSITANFYYGLDEDGKLEIKTITFDDYDYYY